MKQNFWKTINFFRKLEDCFLVETLRLKNHHFHTKLPDQKTMLRPIEWWVLNGACPKNGVLPGTASFFWKILFQCKGVLQNHRPLKGHRPTDRSSINPLTTDNQPTNKCYTVLPTNNNQPPTYPQLLHWPTDHQLTNRSSTEPVTTDHQLTNSPTFLQLTNKPLTQPYFNHLEQPFFNHEIIIWASMF